MKDALGIVTERGRSIFEQIANLVGSIGSTNLVAVSIAATTLSSLVALRVFAPRLPGFIIALGVGNALAASSWSGQKAGKISLKTEKTLGGRSC